MIIKKVRQDNYKMINGLCMIFHDSIECLSLGIYQMKIIKMMDNWKKIPI